MPKKPKQYAEFKVGNRRLCGEFQAWCDRVGRIDPNGTHARVWHATTGYITVPREDVSLLVDSGGYESILVAFAVQGADTIDRQNKLMSVLPKPFDQGGKEFLDCWWIADDDSADGNDDTNTATFIPDASGDGMRQLKVTEAYAILDTITNILNAPAQPQTWVD